jgi:hypothetical protein
VVARAVETFGRVGVVVCSRSEGELKALLTNTQVKHHKVTLLTKRKDRCSRGRLFFAPALRSGNAQEKMGKSVREVLEKAVGMGREANERKVEGDDGDKGIMRVYAQLGEE